MSRVGKDGVGAVSEVRRRSRSVVWCIVLVGIRWLANPESIRGDWRTRAIREVNIRPAFRGIYVPGRRGRSRGPLGRGV